MPLHFLFPFTSCFRSGLCHTCSSHRGRQGEGEDEGDGVHEHSGRLDEVQTSARWKPAFRGSVACGRSCVIQHPGDDAAEVAALGGWVRRSRQRGRRIPRASSTITDVAESTGGVGTHTVDIDAFNRDASASSGTGPSAAKSQARRSRVVSVAPRRRAGPMSQGSTACRPCDPRALANALAANTRYGRCMRILAWLPTRSAVATWMLSCGSFSKRQRRRRPP